MYICVACSYWSRVAVEFLHQSVKMEKDNRNGKLLNRTHVI